MKFVQLLFIIVSLVVLFTSSLFSQNGLSFVGHLDQKHGTSGDNISYSACWGYVAPNGREYAIVGTYTGTQIIDITSTDSIREITHISGPSSIWREMRTYKQRAYVVSEGGSGVQIINLENLPNSANLVRSFNYTSGSKNILRNHSIEIFDGYMYLNGSANWSPGGVLIFSLANVDTPTYVGQYQQEYAHDSYVHGNRLYSASIYTPGGLNVANITNKANPTHITKITYSNAGTHNAWTTTDGNFVITTDEVGNSVKNLKFWDVQNIPPAPTSPIATYRVGGDDIVHNVFVRGNYAYVAWYTAGIQVVDISNPYSPTTAGYYDTSLEPAPGYNGVWAVYPYFWSGKVIAGDMQNGLFVFRFNNLAPRTPVSLLEPANQQAFCSNNPINFKWSRVADPAKDPHAYWFSLKGPGVDTMYVLTTDTSFTLNNVASLANGTYKWYITTKDEATQIATRDTFSFVKTTRSLSLSSPNGSELLKAQSNVNINWSAACVDSVEISYSTDDGSTWNIIQSSLPASGGTYTWNVPNTPTTQGRIRVRDVSDTTLLDLSSSSFTIFVSVNVTVLVPNGGEIWESESMHQISWSYENVSNVTIEYSLDAGGTWTTIIADTSASTGTIDWQLPNVPDTTEALVRIINLSNSSIADTSDATFTIIKIQPQLHLLVPNGGEVWQIGTQQTISWSSLLVDSITIELSVDNGTTWATIVANLPASSGSYLWTVDGEGTTTALVRLKNSADSTLLDQSNAVFEMPVLAVSVLPSWNLVSVPARYENELISNIFSGAASEAFKYVGGYETLDTAIIGNGFWIKYASALTFPIYGLSTSQETIAVREKWNIIGSLSSSFSASTLEPIPPTMTLSQLFGYHPDSGYTIAGTIQPGKGYWLKASEAGSLVLNSSLIASKTMPVDENNGQASLNFKDNKGRVRTLYLRDAEASQRTTVMNELPPIPPSGVFDVRFASQRNTESLSEATSKATIEIRSAEYPLNLTLAGNQHGSYKLVERKQGVIIHEYDFNTLPVISLSSGPEGTLTIETGNSSELPQQISLGQNYPNPFNPVTVISYRLSVNTFVSLKVFNLLGEEVATLVNEVQDAGTKSVEFFADKLSSGVYVYRLTAGNVTEVKRMTVLK
ncbi:MAG: choice-of-anchor B family protein [Ignavibacteriae bacterium]|nr:choice-of-anchor B family protein [Ignavibacteriota bacterium]